MRILGFDPGTAATGFGVVVFDAGRLQLECCGVWRPPASMDLAGKLDFLFGAASELASRIRPDAVSIETVFSAARHVASALKLSHARGVLLAAAARSGVPVFEYEPRLVKKALVGYGQAEKRTGPRDGALPARTAAEPGPARRGGRPRAGDLPPPRDGR